MTTNAEVDPIVQRELLDVLANLYLGTRDRRTPLAAPLYADLQGLPPLLIQVGSSETLLDDSNRLTERAKAAGVDATLEVWEDMIHTWHLFAPILPEGQQAIERIGEFLRQPVRPRSGVILAVAPRVERVPAEPMHEQHIGLAGAVLAAGRNRMKSAHEPTGLSSTRNGKPIAPGVRRETVNKLGSPFQRCSEARTIAGAARASPH